MLRFRLSTRVVESLLGATMRYVPLYPPCMSGHSLSLATSGCMVATCLNPESGSYFAHYGGAPAI
jgi:hypothetical protein